jgi:hypothetical protein
MPQTNLDLESVTFFISRTLHGNMFESVLVLSTLWILIPTVSPIEYVFLINDGSDSCRTDEDLVDLRTVCFPGLNSIDPNLLLKISHIQACQKKPDSKWNC